MKRKYKKIDLTDEERIEIMEKYFEETGKQISTRTVYNEYKIGDWKKVFRKKEKAGSLNLDDEKQKKLEKFGVLGIQKTTITKPIPLKEKIEIMIRYIDQTGKNITGKTEFEGYRIGGWKDRLRAAYWNDKIKLDEECEEKLKEYGIISNKQKNLVPYEEKFKIMKKYIDETGKKITASTEYEGHKIGVWQCNLRCGYRNGLLKLDKDLERQFKECGILIDGYEREKRVPNEVKLELFKKYVKETGQKITTSTVYKGYKLGDWLINYRTDDRRGKERISEEMHNELIKLGVIYPRYDSKLRAFEEKLGITEIEAKRLTSEGIQKGYEDGEEYLDSAKIGCEKIKEDKSIKGFVATSVKLTNDQKKLVLDLEKKIADSEIFPDKFIDADMLVETFHEFNEREKYILKRRYFQTSKNKSLSDISNKFGITRQRVNQIEEDAINKLKKPDCIKKIVIDIKDEIYEKISAEIVPIAVNKVLNNKPTDTVLNSRKYAKIELEKNIMLQDMCIPARIVKKLNGEGINNVYDVNEFYKTVENEKLKKIIEGCGLKNRIDVIIPKIEEDMKFIFSNKEIDETTYALKLAKETKTEKFMFSKRIQNSFRKANIFTGYDIIENLITGNIKEIGGIGEKCQDEIYEQLKKFSNLFQSKENMKKIYKRSIQKNKQENLNYVIEKEKIEKNMRVYVSTIAKKQKAKKERDKIIKLYNAIYNEYYDCENIIHLSEFIKTKQECLEYEENRIKSEKDIRDSKDDESIDYK